MPKFIYTDSKSERDNLLSLGYSLIVDMDGKYIFDSKNNNYKFETLLNDKDRRITYTNTITF